MTGQDHPGMPPTSEVRRIVALMIGEIGDLLVTFPALEALKARYPAASLTLIARPALRELVAAQPSVDEFLPFARPTPFAKAAFLARLMLRRWDLWVDLHTPTFNTWCSNEHVFRRNLLLMRAANAPFKLGFAVPPMADRLTHGVPAPNAEILQTENIVDTTLRVVDQAGQSRWRKSLQIPLATQDAMRERINLAQDGRPLVGLFFGAKQPANVWPESHVADFMAMALEKLPEHGFVLLGGPHEAICMESVTATLPPAHASRVINLTNRLSLLESAAVMSLCRAVVSTDSGPMHLADAVGVPLVTLFGAHSYLPIWLPRQERKVVLNHRPACSLCFASVCDRDNECMRLITPVEVLTALCNLLDEDGPDAA